MLEVGSRCACLISFAGGHLVVNISHLDWIEKSYSALLCCWPLSQQNPKALSYPPPSY